MCFSKQRLSLFPALLVTRYGYSPRTTEHLASIPLSLVTKVSVHDSSFDAGAPSRDYDVWLDLGLYTGYQTCFRLKAYNSAGTSDFSPAVCTVLWIRDGRSGTKAISGSGKPARSCVLRSEAERLRKLVGTFGEHLRR